jgi:hypothetical protein
MPLIDILILLQVKRYLLNGLFNKLSIVQAIQRPIVGLAADELEMA